MKTSNVLFFLILILVPSLCFCSCEDSCVNGKCTQVSNTTYCNCFSGFTGPNCDIQADSTCTFYTPNQLRTQYIPQLSHSSTFYNNILTLVVTAPLVKDRYDYQIYFLGGEGNETCQYPGVFWDKVLDNCTDQFIGNTPWNISLQCGWNVDDTDEEWQIYKTYLVMKNTEKIGDFRGKPMTRSNQHAVPLHVRFKKTIAMSWHVQIFSPFNPMAAVTKQHYEATTSTGILEITTSLQWPFMYTNPIPESFPPGIDGTLLDVTNYPMDCPPNQPCLQRWRLNLQVSEGTCQFTGNYVLKFDQACHESYGPECPIDTNNSVDTIVANIVSEDFCTQVNIDINLSGSMKSYGDDQFNFPKNSFVLGQRAYFKVDMSTNNKASLQTTTVNELYVTDSANTTIFLYQNGELTEKNSSLEFIPISSSSTGFSFLVSQDATPVQVDQNRLYSIVARIGVTYSDNTVQTFSYEWRTSPTHSAFSKVDSGTIEFSAGELIPEPKEPEPHSPFYESQLFKQYRGIICVVGYLICGIVFAGIFFFTGGHLLRKSTEKSKEMKFIFAFAIISHLFAGLRLIGEGLRLIHIYTNLSQLLIAQHALYSIVTVGYFYLISLFIEMWIIACDDLFHATAKKIIRGISISSCAIQSIIFLSTTLLFITLSETISLISYAVGIVISTAISLLFIAGCLGYVGIRWYQTRTLKKEENIIRMTFAMIIIFVSIALYFVYLIGVTSFIGGYQILGTFITFAQSIHEWIIMGVYSILLIPYLKSFASIKMMKKVEIELNDSVNSERSLVGLAM